MRRIVLALLLLRLAGRAVAEPTPVVVLVAFNEFADPWADPMTFSFSPTFALYDDGRVIRHGDAYRTVVLSPTRCKALVASLHLDAIAALPERTVAFDASDQATYNITQFTAGRATKRTVYGFLGEPGVPPAFEGAGDIMTAFDDPAATPWIPPQIEVTFYPEPHPEAAASWPRPDHDGKRRRCAWSRDRR